MALLFTFLLKIFNFLFRSCLSILCNPVSNCGQQYLHIILSRYEFSNMPHAIVLIFLTIQGCRKVWGGLVVLGGDKVLPLVEIGLTDLAKTGGLKLVAALLSYQNSPLLGLGSTYICISREKIPKHILFPYSPLCISTKTGALSRRYTCVSARARKLYTTAPAEALSFGASCSS